MDDCVFCDIVAGKASASMVYEDETVCSFLTIGPVNPGHVLVIPKQHRPFLSDLDEETGMHLFKITMHMAKALRHSDLQCEGINLFLADGEAAFQDVFHVHMHVFPRFQGDPFKIHANWEIKPSRQELDEIAERIRRADAFLRQETQKQRETCTSGSFLNRCSSTPPFGTVPCRDRTFAEVFPEAGSAGLPTRATDSLPISMMFRVRLNDTSRTFL